MIRSDPGSGRYRLPGNSRRWTGTSVPAGRCRLRWYCQTVRSGRVPRTSRSRSPRPVSGADDRVLCWRGRVRLLHRRSPAGYGIRWNGRLPVSCGCRHWPLRPHPLRGRWFPFLRCPRRLPARLGPGQRAAGAVGRSDGRLRTWDELDETYLIYDNFQPFSIEYVLGIGPTFNSGVGYWGVWGWTTGLTTSRSRSVRE